MLTFNWPIVWSPIILSLCAKRAAIGAFSEIVTIGSVCFLCSTGASTEFSVAEIANYILPS